MSVDHIRYDILAQDALRGVVRTVVVDAAKHGLPGEHHFYITFSTRAEGVACGARAGQFRATWSRGNAQRGQAGEWRRSRAARSFSKKISDRPVEPALTSSRIP